MHTPREFPRFWTIRSGTGYFLLFGTNVFGVFNSKEEAIEFGNKLHNIRPQFDTTKIIPLRKFLSRKEYIAECAYRFAVRLKRVITKADKLFWRAFH
jgi:hypothetical protein